MTSHLLLPGIDLELVDPREEYRSWLIQWMETVTEELNQDSASSSMCLQGAIAELVLFKRLKTDWRGILDDLLTDEQGNPLAYSEVFGRKLYGFRGQWRQTPVHAVHAHFWVKRLASSTPQPIDKWGKLIQGFIQPSGWIYNLEVSPTNLVTRMKSEYFMSMAMGIELLRAAGLLDTHSKQFKATLTHAARTDYLSAEHFRLSCLEQLDAQHLRPQQLEDVLRVCEAGEGYCDFSVESKVDDYMGTAKRTSRDVAVHSPIAGLHAHHVAQYCDNDVQAATTARLKNFYQHLAQEPFDIKAFTIRDLLVPFGTALSPVEVIAASAQPQVAP